WPAAGLCSCEPGLPAEPERTELKMLRRAPGGEMIVPARVDKGEPGAKRLAQAFSIVPGDRQPAAPLGAVERERADDGAAAGPQRAAKPGDIGGLVGRVGEKV